jgi:hypothetical protein
MSKLKQERVKVGKLCFTCINSCKEIAELDSCPHYKQTLSRFEYLKLIKELGINVKKLCNQYGISYNIMMNMLHGRQLFHYKYYVILNSRIYELSEYLPHIEKWNTGNFDDCESSEGDLACGQNEEKVEE